MTDYQATQQLLTALADAGEGYETAAKDADTPDLAAVFARIRRLHERHRADIDAAARKAGENPDESPSVMATVHRTVISVRAAVTGLGANAMPGFVDGEERIIKAYDKAIAERDMLPMFAQMLRRQRSELLDEIAAMRTMEPR